MSNAEIALEGLFYPLFLVAVLASGTLGIVCAGIWFGLMPFCATFAVVVIPLYTILNKREKAEQQRLTKPTRFPTDEERHKAIDYIFKTKKQT